MDEKTLQKYLKAGKICAEIKKETLEWIKPGMKILDVAEKIEAAVLSRGGKPAFPVNISINEAAAHYTPRHGDDVVIGSGDLVKIDLGVHVDGYIGDLAFTYCSEKNNLVETVNQALEAGIKVIRPGIEVYEIGKAIGAFVKERGLGLIVNLTGHGLGKFDFHKEPSIPNIENESSYQLKEDEVVALEPFVCDTNGSVKESESVKEIFQYLQDRPVRLFEARKILELARDEYNGLPFAKRWLFKKFSPVKISLGLRQLEDVNAIMSYPVLKEISGKKIAQAEHTIIVKGKPIVTTKL